MHVDAAGLAFIAREEGCILHPYNDSAGHATIGVGHLLHFGPVTAADIRRWRGFTRADAIHLLHRDIAECEGEINRDLRRPANQNEFNAFGSIAFNIGLGGFRTSTFLRRFNSGDRRGCADAMLWWNHPPELDGRRHRERALFLTPVHHVDPLRVLTPTERRWCREYDDLKRHNRNRPRREELRAAMKRERKRIWRLAQPKPKGGDGHGWDHAHRRRRYAELLHRSS